jgi:hypothetical protein
MCYISFCIHMRSPRAMMTSRQMTQDGILADDAGKASSLQHTFKPIIFFWKLRSNWVL